MFSGFIAILGKPNVGKSTLLNTILEVKVAPISPKPQTTRKGLRGILTRDDRQIVFIDTPGLHKPQDVLDKYMNAEVHSAINDVDGVIFVVDLRHPPTEEDKLVARELSHFEKQIYLVGNKVDVAKYPDEALEHYANLLDKDVKKYKVSAMNGKFVNQLVSDLFENLPESEFYFPNNIKSDQSREFWAAEIIREEVMKAVHSEIPYAIAVLVKDWHEKKDGMQVIKAEIFVERESHKGIVIGRQAKMLKEIGQKARKQLETFLVKKVFLELDVKVMSDWRRDPEALRQLGFDI